MLRSMPVKVRIGCASNSAMGRYYEELLRQGGVPAVAEMGMGGSALDFSQPSDIWCVDPAVLADVANVDFIRELLGKDTSEQVLAAAQAAGEEALQERQAELAAAADEFEEFN